jgi:1-deoxy-D-xylulose-5-phosphate reductoisomerase
VQVKRLGLLGSTGSIGVSTCEVVSQNTERFSFDFLIAGSNAERLAEQIKNFKPRVAGLADTSCREKLTALLGVSPTCTQWQDTTLLFGEDEILQAIRTSDASLVVAAVVGMAGLSGVVAALESGKDVALANKESLVVAGGIVTALAKRKNKKIIPVDREHSAIFQALQGVQPEDIASIILTASGGPFRTTAREEFATITPERALKHPQWDMGAKISIDSATLMNKALEVIEARWLFDVATSEIEVVVHPQSIIHSMVRLIDGGLLAQLSVPDMKGPIAYALSFGDINRIGSVMPHLDFAALGKMTFEDVDSERFPSIRWAFSCLNGSNGDAVVLNTVNEIAVERFLARELSFVGIFSLIENGLRTFSGKTCDTLNEIVELSSAVSDWARQITISR